MLTSVPIYVHIRTTWVGLQYKISNFLYRIKPSKSVERDRKGEVWGEGGAVCQDWVKDAIEGELADAGT